MASTAAQASTLLAMGSCGSAAAASAKARKIREEAIAGRDLVDIEQKEADEADVQ
jgi:hypothetical protein